MVSTRFAKLLIDTADTLASARTAKEAWDATLRVSRRIGAAEVNCGAIMSDSRELAWLRSSMDPAWLRHYHESRFYEIDSVLAACKAGTPRQFLDITRCMSSARDPRRRELFSCLLSYSYRFFVADTWKVGATERTVVLACNNDPLDLYGPGTMRAFRAVSAMLCDAVQPPGEETAQEWVCDSPWALLTAGERDVLSYLAHGMALPEVAERLTLSAQDADRRLFSACRKLGVAAPEQALSLAMARGVLAL